MLQKDSVGKDHSYHDPEYVWGSHTLLQGHSKNTYRPLNVLTSQYYYPGDTFTLEILETQPILKL